MMESNEQENQNVELTDNSEENPLTGTTDSKNDASFSGSKDPDPNPITGELSNNTATSENIKPTPTTKQSWTGFENNTSTKHDASNSSVSSKESSSYPSPSMPYTHQLPKPVSPVPLITLTPATPESVDSNSTQYLHYFLTYNPDGTITAYPIYPYDPTSPSMVGQSQRQLAAFQGNKVSDDTASLQAYKFQDPAIVSQVFGSQSNVSVCQSNTSPCQAVAQSNAQTSQARAQSNLPVFQESQSYAQGFQRNETVFQYSNATTLHDNRSNASGYQHVQSNTSMRHDVLSNPSVYQDVQTNSPVHQHQSNSSTSQDQNSESVFEEHQLYDNALPHFVPYQEANCGTISNPSFTSWYGRHAAVESRLVAAVRAIAWEKPKFIGLFSNRDKHFLRNKQTSEEKFEANNPVSEITLPPSPTSTTSLNESSLPQTSPSQVEPQSNFLISEISLPLDQAETTLSEVTSSPVLTPPSSAIDFKFNFPISDIPLPLDPMPTESSSDAKLTEMASVATIKKSSSQDFKVNIPISEIPLPLDTPPAILSPEVELNTNKTFFTGIPIAEIPLPFDDTDTKSLRENNLPEGTSSSTLSQVNSTEIHERNFPISEIPLPLELSQKSIHGNKLPLVKLSPFGPEGCPTDQACAMRYDEASTASEITFRQDSILNISKESYGTENIVSEFTKKCTIHGDELEEKNALGAEKLLLAGRFGLDVINKGKQNSSDKAHYKSKTENTKTSVDADKSCSHSKTPNTASNEQDKQKIPKHFQQGSNPTIDPKNVLAQSKSQVKNKSKIFDPSSKSSIVETEKKTRGTSENETFTRSENDSTSSNAEKQPDIRKKEGISSSTQKESDRSKNSKAKISYSKSKVERKNKGNYSKLQKSKFENSLNATENETKSALPKVDIMSDMEKIFQRGFKDAIDSMEKIKLSKLKSEFKKMKGTPLQSRISVSESKTDIQSISASTKNTFDERPKTDIPKIQLTEHNKPILPKETMTQSRLKADVSPEGAKASDAKVAFVKPNTKRGLEQILFSKSCVPLSGPTTLVETGMKKITPEKSVPRGVLKTLYRHRDSVQKFIEKKAGSEDLDESLVLSMETAEIKSMTERKSKMAAIGTESTTLKSSKTRKRRSKKKYTKDSPAENDKEPNITG